MVSTAWLVAGGAFPVACVTTPAPTRATPARSATSAPSFPAAILATDGEVVFTALPAAQAATASPRLAEWSFGVALLGTHALKGPPTVRCSQGQVMEVVPLVEGAGYTGWHRVQFVAQSDAGGVLEAGWVRCGARFVGADESARVGGVTLEIDGHGNVRVRDER